MPWYDYHYNAGQSDTHKFAGKDWWLDAFGTGLVLDREAFRQAMEQQPADKTYKYVLTKDNNVL